MRKAVVRFSIVSISAGLLVSGCGSYNASWPKLGPRDAAAAGTMEQDIQPAAAQTQNAASPIGEAAVLTDNIRTRLGQATATFADTQRRAVKQRQSLQKALRSVASVNSSSWSTAQMELSRLNEIDVELIELRREASGIAGDVAALHATGLPVDDLVDQTGSLINIIKIEIEQVTQVRDSARATLAS